MYLPIMASEKQVNYLMYLLDKNGYDTEWLGSEYKRLGLSMSERSGKVRPFLEGLESVRASKMIKKLL